MNNNTSKKIKLYKVIIIIVVFLGTLVTTSIFLDRVTRNDLEALVSNSDLPDEHLLNKTITINRSYDDDLDSISNSELSVVVPEFTGTEILIMDQSLTPQPEHNITGATPSPIDIRTITYTVADLANKNPQVTLNKLTPYSSISTPLIGIETHLLWDKFILDKTKEIGASWIRHNALYWSAVESYEGERNWDAVSNLEMGLIESSRRGLNVILMVRSTPLWAQKVSGSYCGPISQEKLQYFARFMTDLVARYSQPPYNVKFWEMGNEPDIDPSLVKGDNIFGCWGNSEDIYYGGGYYAEMLKVVYPAVKSVDPDAKLLIGGLLLDCDPTHPPEGKDCLPAKFLEGILSNNGGDYFDFVSFHGYPNYNGSLKNELEIPAWQPRGGTTLGRANFLREVMGQFGISKPLLLTESSLLCPEWNKNHCDPPGDDFYEAQADYAVRMYVRNWAGGIAGMFWYHMEGPGWRYCGLINSIGQPKQAYRALQFFTNKIGSSIYNKTYNIKDSVYVYEFLLESQKVWVIWSDDDIDYRIPLPTGVSNIYDKYGTIIPADQGYINVNSPVYLEFTR